MSLDGLSTWKSTFKAAVPPVGDATWPDNFTNWYTARVNAPKLELPGLTIASGTLPVTFGSAAFLAVYATLAAGLTQAAAMGIIADAWEAGLNASSVAVVAGDSIGSPSPTTTWSVVNSCVFDAASITAGKAKIMELVGASNAADALDSEVPVKFREATLLLTVTTEGKDSTPSGSGGPLTLNDNARAVG